MGFWQEFREFAVKGNAVDMAVGIVIGAAFTKVVNSIVNDIIMPAVGMMIGRVEFKDLQVVLHEAYTTEAGEAVPAVAIRYGVLVNTVIEFLIVALAIFVVIKMMNRVVRSRSAAPAA